MGRNLALLAALAFVPLAGCVQGTQEDPLFGRCPDWQLGDGPKDWALSVQGNDTSVLEPVATFKGLHADLFRFDITAVDVPGGYSIEGRAYDGNGTALGWRDFLTTNGTIPVLRLTPRHATHTVEVALAPLTHADGPGHLPLRNEWRVLDAMGQPTAEHAEVTGKLSVLYRICGL